MSARDLPFLWSPPPGSSGGVAFVDRAGQGLTPPAEGGRLAPNPHLQEVQLLEGVFDDAQCDRIVELGQSRPRWNGRCTSDDPDYRVCLTSWLERQDANAWVFERIAQVVHEANRSLRFELDGFGEPLHYVEYGPGGGFEWHSDLTAGRASNRKLSVSLQLSSPAQYTGGQLELCPHGVMGGFRERGSVLVFPAYIPHRVLRIGSGMRRALVAWIHGPAFR